MELAPVVVVPCFAGRPAEEDVARRLNEASPLDHSAPGFRVQARREVGLEDSLDEASWMGAARGRACGRVLP